MITERNIFINYPAPEIRKDFRVGRIFHETDGIEYAEGPVAGGHRLLYLLVDAREILYGSVEKIQGGQKRKEGAHVHLLIHHAQPSYHDDDRGARKSDEFHKGSLQDGGSYEPPHP